MYFLKDEFKDYVYSRKPEKYAQVDIGNISREKSIRTSLNCKPFRYFFEYVAPDMLERYPIIPRGFFAKGVIQSKVKSNLCVAIASNSRGKKLDLAECDKNKASPAIGQFFNLTWYRNLQHANFDICVSANLNLEACHYMGDNQLWKLDIDTSQLINYKTNSMKCLTLDNTAAKLTMEECNVESKNQKWNFFEKNITALLNWETSGVDLKTFGSLDDFYS